MKPPERSPAYFILLASNTILTLLFFVEAVFSLQWRMLHDNPILYYMGFLVAEQGAVPYRDFFDMNMPGVYWLNALIGSMFGFTDAGLQWGNLLLLLITLLLIFFWLRSFGWMAAWTGIVFFGVFFLQYGPGMSMQREFITLPLLLGALLSFPLSVSNTGRSIKTLISGFLIGLSVLIKPQSGLMLLVLLFAGYLSADRSSMPKKGKSALESGMRLIIGFSLPLIMAIVCLAQLQVLDAFFSMATNYWPLYNAFNGRLEIAVGINKILAPLDGIRSAGANILWLAPAIYGFFHVVFRQVIPKKEKLKTYLMAGAALVSMLEVFTANKYWEHHWLPMFAFLILLSAVGLVSPPFQARPQVIWPFLVSLLFLVIFVLRPADEFWDQVNAEPPPAPKGGRVDEIADYLKKNLGPKDTVQPLDWTNGAVQAMLAVQAKPATRYLYDFYFYHHVSNPEIQYIRQDLLNQMAVSKPKVIIQFYQGRPWVSGPDTTREFPELQEYLDDHYYLDREKNDYRLWMRK